MVLRSSRFVQLCLRHFAYCSIGSCQAKLQRFATQLLFLFCKVPASNVCLYGLCAQVLSTVKQPYNCLKGFAQAVEIDELACRYD